MLNGSSSERLHFAQNASLILLSVFALPLDNAGRRRIRLNPSFRPKTILVTGVGMSKGLAIARMFYQGGHNVIGADFEPYGVTVCGRYSRALYKFYRLPKPNEQSGAAFYIQELLRVIHHEEVDLWVSCSGVTSAVEDGQAKEVIEKQTDCKAIQYDADTTGTLHEKYSFIQHTQALGLPVPETHDVTSRGAVHKVLEGAAKQKKRYIMKSVGVDDSMRGDMTILPKRTVSQTYGHISRMPISPTKPWVLQQFVRGKEYCTHALVVRGEVQAFVACPSSELLMHYEALPDDSALGLAMLKFTQEFVSRSNGAMTGHLSFDFLVEEKVTEKGLEDLLLPIECNPRAHTAVVLFNGLGREMSDRYLRALSNPHADGATKSKSLKVLSPHSPASYYWVGHDLVELVLLPLLKLLTMRLELGQFLAGCWTFLYHLLFWKDGTYELWDPLPWFWLYHVYWPGQFLASLLQGRKWSRINVSTTKMFEC